MKRISLAIVLVLVLVGCGKPVGSSAEINTSINKSNTVNSGNFEESALKVKLKEIGNYISRDVWGSGFVDISWYLATGKNNTGATMDIDLTIELLSEKMKKKPDYDKFILGLDDDKFAKVKKRWNLLSPEIDKLYDQINTKKPTANNSDYNFDTGLVDQYMDSFIDSVNELD